MWQDNSVPNSVALLLSLMAVDLLAAITPGPNFVLVTQTAIHRTRRHAAAVVLGFVISNLIWCSAVVLGFSALFDLAPWLYQIVRIGGALYLIYFGINLWRSDEPKDAPPASEGFLNGLLTNLTNPKSLVYFGSIFALFVPPGTPLWLNAAAIGIVIFNTIAWYGTVSALFSHEIVQRRFVSLQRPINRIAGTVMIAFGARLILARR
jgi:RhtB (resistance to homoserine/threonine) family protein